MEMQVVDVETDVGIKLADNLAPGLQCTLLERQSLLLPRSPGRFTTGTKKYP